MKTSLKLEELAMLLLGIFLFSQLNFSWWWFIGLFLLLGIGAIAAYVYLYVLGEKEDEELVVQDENPEQVEATDDGLDIEDMEIEDDDIVVEETS